MFRACAVQRRLTHVATRPDVTQRDPQVAGHFRNTCRACALAKATRARRSKSKLRPASRPFEILDADYITVDEPSFSGYRHAFTVTDRSSRYRWSIPLKAIRHGPAAFVKFMAERKAEGLISGAVALQGDNAMLTEPFRKACRESNVRPQSCAPYAHWQNGIAERGFCTLMESTRAMLINARLPKTYWALAFVNATAIQNVVGRER